LLSSIGFTYKDYRIKGLILPQRKRLTTAQGQIRHEVRQVLAEHTKPGQRLLIAVSGGADSMALASATLFESKKLGLATLALTVDHGLQRKSAAVAIQTQQKLLAIGFKQALIKKVNVGKTGGPEAAARKSRYQALEQVRLETKSDWIVLGHTLDDQAETVLLGLARGSGARSLSGMSVVTGKLLRPLLSVGRKATVQFCKDEQIQFWKDPQNRSLKFLRVRVRSKVIPFLEKQLGPGIALNLIRSADQLKIDDDYLSAVAVRQFKKLAKTTSSSVSIEVAKLEKLPEAILHRVLKESIDCFQLDSSRKHVLAVADLITNWHGQKPLSLPGIRVLRKDKTITFKVNQEK
jgi:tRNA(Ile)-lysidine synthase